MTAAAIFLSGSTLRLILFKRSAKTPVRPFILGALRVRMRETAELDWGERATDIALLVAELCICGHVWGIWIDAKGADPVEPAADAAVADANGGTPNDVLARGATVDAIVGSCIPFGNWQLIGNKNIWLFIDAFEVDAAAGQRFANIEEDVVTGALVMLVE